VLAHRLRLAALALAVLLAAAGCGNRADPGASVPAAGTEARPADGDGLVLPIHSDPATLNLVTGTDAYWGLVARLVADSLVDEGPDLSPVPRLAESWEFSADRRLLTFRLRPGVRWHDGAPLRAEDVLFTFAKIREAPGGPKADLLQDVEEVSAPDGKTLVVRYREPTVLALDGWKFPIVPEHRFRGEDFFASERHRSPLGTGPFRFVSYERGRQIVLEANSDYFLGRPHLDRIVLKIIPSPVTQFRALLAGEVDYAPVPPEEWDRVSGSEEFRDRFRLYRYPTLFLSYIAWNTRSPFFSDPRVREAMTLLVDRPGILRTLYRGAGRIAATSFHPQQFGFDSRVQPHPFDPARAQSLLDAAGWRRDGPGGPRTRQGRAFRFTLLVFQGDALQEQIASLLKEELRKAGVEMEVRILDWPALLQRLKDHGFEAAVSGWLLTPDPDPAPFFHSDPSVGVSNYVGYSDPEMDRLLLEARHAFEPARRREIYARVQQILHRDQPYTFLFFPPNSFALDARYEGVRLSEAAGILRWYPAILDWYVPRERRKRP
jgi:peptide/nickel transport system substrate-binding protein